MNCQVLIFSNNPHELSSITFLWNTNTKQFRMSSGKVLKVLKVKMFVLKYLFWKQCLSVHAYYLKKLYPTESDIWGSCKKFCHQQASLVLSQVYFTMLHCTWMVCWIANDTRLLCANCFQTDRVISNWNRCTHIHWPIYLLHWNMDQKTEIRSNIKCHIRLNIDSKQIFNELCGIYGPQTRARENRKNSRSGPKLRILDRFQTPQNANKSVQQVCALNPIFPQPTNFHESMMSKKSQTVVFPNWQRPGTF